MSWLTEPDGRGSSCDMTCSPTLMTIPTVRFSTPPPATATTLADRKAWNFSFISQFAQSVYVLYRRGIEVRIPDGARDFSAVHRVQIDSGAHSGYRGCFSGVKAGRRLKLTTPPRSLDFKNCGAVPPLPHIYLTCSPLTGRSLGHRRRPAVP